MSNFFIPDPCHENWNKMTPAEQGRHCAVCSKTVVDFTARKEEEINSILAEQTGRVCGHFRVGQLNASAQSKVFRNPVNLFGRNWKYFVMATLGFLSLKKTEAQIRGKIAPIRGDVMPVEQHNTNTSETRLFGTVYMNDGKPAGQAEIVISSGGIEIMRTNTIANGSYSIKIKPGLIQGKKVDISVYHPYGDSKYIHDLGLSKTSNKLNITLEHEIMLKGEIAYIEPDPVVDTVTAIAVTCSQDTTIHQQPEDSIAKNIPLPADTARIPVQQNHSQDNSTLFANFTIRPEDVTMVIYPNPAGTSTTVYCNKAATYKIELFDEKGALKLSKAFHGDRTNLDISALGNGFYFVNVRDDDGHSNIMKLVKQ